MNRDKCRMLREKLDAILKANPIDGLVVRIGNASFNETSVTFKVEVAEKSADGLALTKEANDFKQMAEFCGFKPEDLHKVVTLNRDQYRSDQYRIVGAKWRRKMPILMERVRDKKIYLFTARAVQVALGYTPNVGAGMVI